MSITLRIDKQDPLTFTQADINFSSFYYSSSIERDQSDDRILKLHFTGSDQLGSGYSPNRSDEIPLGVLKEDGVVLEGTQYIYVQANGTDVENAQELQAAYNKAKTMILSATNRITIVAGIGSYDFETSSFDMDTNYIDLVSLDGNRSVVFNHTLNTSDRTEGSINITANDVFVKGVDVGTKNFTIGDSLNLLKVKNCKGGESSFGGDTPFGSNPIIVSGTFIDCVGGDESFGGAGGTASGIFTDCVGEMNSFGGFEGIASGTFTNCQGGTSSFGGEGGTATEGATFINCQGGAYSFGGFINGIAAGTFRNCQGGAYSFGSSGIASGIFIDCTGGIGSFGGGGTANGIFTNCQGGDFGSFGGLDTASGTFTDCAGYDQSFGGDGGAASGTFTNCVGGSESFGDGGTLSGKLYYCRLTSGTFETVSGAGKIILGIDGNDDIINS